METWVESGGAFSAPTKLTVNVGSVHTTLYVMPPETAEVSSGERGHGKAT